MSHFGGIIRSINGNTTINGDLDLTNHNINNVTLFDGRNLSDLYDTTKAPSGFPNRTDTILSGDAGTRTFTIAPSAGSFSFYVHGIKFTHNAPVTVNWNNTEGLWFFYFDTTGAIQATQDTNVIISIILGDGASFSTLYWDSTNGAIITLADERHDFMTGTTHLYLHECFGAQWFSGGALGNIVSDGDGSADNQAELSVGNTIFFDEDIRFTINGGSPQTLFPIGQLPVYYQNGAAANWRKANADNFPFIYSGKGGYVGGSGRIPYNQFTGVTWQLTEADEGDFVLVHIFATNDIDEPIIAIQGQNEYASLGAARTGAETEINTLTGVSRLLTSETAPLGTIILQTSSAFGNTPKAIIRKTAEGGDYVDFRGNPIVGSGASVENHGNLAGLQNDDHLIYLLTTGARDITGTFQAFSTSVVGPTLLQKPLLTVGTGNTLTVHSQDTTTVGAGSSVGGALIVRAGNASGAVTANTGGALTLASGSGATANGVINVNIGATALMQFLISTTTGDSILQYTSTAPTPKFMQAGLTATGTGAQMYLHAQDSQTAGVGSGNVGGSLAGRAGMASGSTNTAGNIGGFLEWTGGNATSDGYHLGTGGSATIRSGDANITIDGYVTLTGGSTFVRGGRALGVNPSSKEATLQGGPVTVAGGMAGYDNTTFQYGATATGGSATVNGGDGYGQTTLACVGGPTTIRGGNAISLGGAGSTAVAGSLTLQGGTASGAITNTNGNVYFGSTNIAWLSSVVTPNLYQVAMTAVGTGTAMTINSQDALVSAAGSNVGAALTVRSGNASGAVTNNTGGALTISTGSGATANGVLNIQTGGVNRITLNAAGTTVSWDAAIVGPTWTQDNKTTAGTAAAMTVHAQSTTGANAATGGSLTINAGDNACTSGAETGGAITVRSGDVSGASGGANIGGATTVRGGNATSGSTNTGGALTLSSGSGATANGILYLQTGGTNRISLNAAGAQFSWDTAITNPIWMQDDKTTSGTGTQMTLHAQNLSGAVFGTSGALVVNAGDNSGTGGGANTGGASTFRSGDVSGADGYANLGGNCTVRAGNATSGSTNTGGDLTLSSGSGATNPGSLFLQSGGSSKVSINATGAVTFFTSSLLWANSVSAPTLVQQNSGAGGTGQLLTITAQTISGGAGTNIGGAILVNGGQSTGVAGQTSTGGNATFSAGAGIGVGTTSTGGALTANGGDVSGSYTVAGNGGAATFRAGDVTGATLLACTGGKTTIRAGNATSVGGAGSTAAGGHMLIAGGTGSGAVVSNLVGNIAFHADPALWQSGQKIIFIGEAAAVPIASPAAGGFLYVEGGALKYRSANGTTTTIAP